jgi:hypothetical protein
MGLDEEWSVQKKSGYRDELLDRIMDAIARTKEGQVELRRATLHICTRLTKCIDVDGGIFEMHYKLTNLSLEQ